MGGLTTKRYEIEIKLVVSRVIILIEDVDDATICIRREFVILLLEVF